jgi:hypothetical protein
MSTVTWRGDAQAIAQVNTLTVGGTPVNGQAYNVLINGKTVTYTSTGTDTTATIASSLQALLTGARIGEFGEITWTVSGSVITATAATAGVPFTQTSSVGAGTGTLTTTTTVTGSGPNDVSLAANWSTGSLPASGDDVTLANSTSGLLYNLSALSAVTLNSLTIDSTFTGNIGLPRTNANGYVEYRPTYWQIGATTVTTLAGTGGGSGRIRLDLGSAATTLNINATGSPIDQGKPALQLKAINAANVLNILQGNVGVAVEPGELSTLVTINIGYQSSQQTDVTLTLGSGCTLTTINQDGGSLTVNSNVTTLTQRGGNLIVYGTAAITTLDIESGNCRWQSSGTLGTVTLGSSGGGGSLDFSRDPRTRTVTNLTLNSGTTLLDPNKTVTFTNPLYLQRCGLDQVKLDLGADFHLARS